MFQYKIKTLNPRWLEQFNLYFFEDQTSHLEISVYDHDVGGRDDIMGRSEPKTIGTCAADSDGQKEIYPHEHPAIPHIQL